MNNVQPLNTQPLFGAKPSANWLMVLWMKADVHKIGNDRWTHPPLINKYNWIMRVNSVSTHYAKVNMLMYNIHASLLYGKAAL